MSDSETIICRPSKTNFYVGLIALLTSVGLAGLVWLVPPVRRTGDTEIWVLVSLILLLFGGLGVWCLLEFLRCAVIADQNGLELRGIRKTRRFAWSEIEDYYIRLAPPGNNGPKQFFIVQTRGKKWTLPQNNQNFAALQTAIQERATQAKAKDWQPVETRDLLDSPQIFEYGTTRIWPVVLMGVGMSLLFPIQLIADLVFKGGWGGVAARFTQFGSLWMNLGVFGTVVLMSLLMASLVWLQIPALQTRKKFDGQKIIADKGGLQWVRGSQIVQMRWEEIEWFGFEKIPGHLQQPLCVVKSPRERIEFHAHIGKARILRLLIQQNAKNTAVKGWSYAPGQDVDLLRKPAPRIDGIEVFTLQTRSSRALLLGGTLMALLIFLPIFWGTARDNTGYFVGGALLLGCAWGWLCFFRSRLQVEAEGIRHIGPLGGEKFLEWRQIEFLSQGQILILKGRKKSLYLSPLWGEVERILGIVAEKSGKEWQKTG